MGKAAEATHKVLSLGMWLKLDTGMLLMLLLFSVLRDMEEKKGEREGGATRGRWFSLTEPPACAEL